MSAGISVQPFDADDWELAAQLIALLSAAVFDASALRDLTLVPGKGMRTPDGTLITKSATGEGAHLLPALLRRLAPRLPAHTKWYGHRNHLVEPGQTCQQRTLLVEGERDEEGNDGAVVHSFFAALTGEFLLTTGDGKRVTLSPREYCVIDDAVETYSITHISGTCMYLSVFLVKPFVPSIQAA